MVEHSTGAASLHQDSQADLRVKREQTSASEMSAVSQEELYPSMCSTQLKRIDVLATQLETKPDLPDEMRCTHALPWEDMRSHERVRRKSHITASVVRLSEKSCHNSTNPFCLF
eukprot:6492682-Amphidinium_carterae.1